MDPLAHLPFHNTIPLSSFLVLEDFTTCCPNHQCSPSHLLLVVLSIRTDCGSLLQMNSFSIATNFLLASSNIPACISFSPTHTVILPYISPAILYWTCSSLPLFLTVTFLLLLFFHILSWILLLNHLCSWGFPCSPKYLLLLYIPFIVPDTFPFLLSIFCSLFSLLPTPLPLQLSWVVVSLSFVSPLVPYIYILYL